MFKGKVSRLDGIDLWYESFGCKENPCFLLIMGGGCQGILWPDLFCQKLASLGFFVIRFDSRDTGRSSYFDYTKSPYTLLDMAKDAILLLDFLKIEKANLLGTSMGGAIAQIMAAHFPDRVKSLSLIATTADLRNLVGAIQGRPSKGLPLSAPSKECVDWIELISLNHQSLSWLQKIKTQFEGWKMLNGPKAPFDAIYYSKMFLKTLCRQRSYTCLLNHVYALISSVDLLLDTVGKIDVPTVVIQGRYDPIFPKDHAEFLAKSMLMGELLLIDKMGHNLNACFYQPILDKIDSFIERK